MHQATIAIHNSGLILRGDINQVSHFTSEEGEPREVKQLVQELRASGRSQTFICILYRT